MKWLIMSHLIWIYTVCKYALDFRAERVDMNAPLTTYALKMVTGHRFIRNWYFEIFMKYLGSYEIQNIHFVHQIHCHVGCLYFQNVLDLRNLVYLLKVQLCLIIWNTDNSNTDNSNCCLSQTKVLIKLFGFAVCSLYFNSRNLITTVISNWKFRSILLEFEIMAVLYLE